MTADNRQIKVYDLGSTNYPEVHGLQKGLQATRGEGKGEDTLLLTEHRPVITLGRSHLEPSLKVGIDAVTHYGIEILPTERGGDITYHGPGQLVAYGIIHLREWEVGALDYVTGLEETVIGVLGDWGVRGERQPKARGVWTGGRKIASVGINVRRWVTMHGIALNVATDMSHFDLINPCGMKDVEMTSLSQEIGKQVHVPEVTESFVFHFGRVFSCQATLAEVPAVAGGRK